MRTSVDPSSGTAYCAAAAEADRKVEMLGGEVVNPLEKRVADLEDLELEQRVNALDERVRPYEDYKTLVDEQVRKLREVEQLLSKRKNDADTAVQTTDKDQRAALEELAAKVDVPQSQVDQQRGNEKENSGQQLSLTDITARVAELENASVQPPADANALALDLLDRLQQGDTVHLLVAKQLGQLLMERSKSSSSDAQQKATASKTKPHKAPPRDTHLRLNSGISKRRGAPLKHGRYARTFTQDEMEKPSNGGRRKSTSSSASSLSLPMTPDADTPSSRPSGLLSNKKSKASPDKMEVPETQQQDDGDVDMEGRDEAEDDEDDDRPFIPGERRNGRVPKPRRFMDQVDWKEANERFGV